MAVGRWISAGLLLLGAAACWYFLSARETTKVFEPVIQQVEPASPCPWRKAEEQLTNWFPGATEYRAQDIILSGQRSALQEKLGRPLQPEDMALHTYVVTSNQAHLGTVMTRRVKADHGAVELAMAIRPDKKLHKLEIQRIREPSEVVTVLEAYDLEARFQNLGVQDEIAFAGAASDEPKAAAAKLAQAIAKEVKTLLILYEAGDRELRAGHH